MDSLRVEFQNKITGSYDGRAENWLYRWVKGECTSTMLDIAPQALRATMEPKSDVRWLRSTSGYLTGAYWCLLVLAGAYGHLLEPEAIWT